MEEHEKGHELSADLGGLSLDDDDDEPAEKGVLGNTAGTKQANQRIVKIRICISSYIYIYIF